MIWLIFLLLAACGPVGSAAEPSGPTWHHDIRPIIVHRCGECHSPGGVGGLALTESADAVVVRFALTRVHDGTMPPWPPSADGLPIANRREIDTEEVRLIERWLERPALGDPASAPPAPPTSYRFQRPPELQLIMPEPYLSSSRVASDEIRCLVLPALPPPYDKRSAFIEGYDWIVGSPRAMHHIVAAIVPPAGVPTVHDLDARDPGPGFECAAGDFPLIASLNNSSIGPDGGFRYPDPYGVEVPAGGRVMLQVHYLPAFQRAADVSGVKLWLRSSASPIKVAVYTAPSDVPCPTGISNTYGNPCNRQTIADRFRPGFVAENDRLLAACGQSMASRYAAPFTTTIPPHWYFTSACPTKATPGKVFSVHMHAHTRASAVSIKACPPAGPCVKLLDIPKWSWPWESAYTLQKPFPLDENWTVIPSCTWDNGDLAQPNLETGEPGHYGPALAPRRSPEYLLPISSRLGEMCQAVLEMGD